MWQHCSGVRARRARSAGRRVGVDACGCYVASMSILLPDCANSVLRIFLLLCEYLSHLAPPSTTHFKPTLSSGENDLL